MGGGLGHLPGQVQEGISLEAPGMGREEGRGQGTALHGHGRKDGDGYRQRAAAEAGEIVDGGDAGRWHGRSSLQGISGAAPRAAKARFSVRKDYISFFPIVQGRMACYNDPEQGMAELADM